VFEVGANKIEILERASAQHLQDVGWHIGPAQRERARAPGVRLALMRFNITAEGTRLAHALNMHCCKRRSREPAERLDAAG
jgi:hypothetical protein